MAEEDSRRIANVRERQMFWTDMLRNEDIQPKDRLKASELLGKSQGDFLERHESAVHIDGLVQIYLPANGRD